MWEESFLAALDAGNVIALKEALGLPGADVNTPVVKYGDRYYGRVRCLNELFKPGDTALHMAVRLDNRELVTEILTFGPDTTLRNADGLTALEVTANPVLRRALTYGLSRYTPVDRPVSMRKGLPAPPGPPPPGTPKMMLGAHDKSKSFNTEPAPKPVARMAKYPSAHSPDASHELGEDLIAAAKMGDVARIKSLLGRGAPGDFADADGTTALHWATSEGFYDAVEALLIAGVNPCPQNKEGSAPVHWAAYKGLDDIVELLMAKWPYEEIKDKYLCTPLHYAAMDGHGDICQIFLRAGADLLSKDEYGKTPIALAAEGGHEKLVVWLKTFLSDDPGTHAPATPRGGMPAAVPAPAPAPVPLRPERSPPVAASPTPAVPPRPSLKPVPNGMMLGAGGMAATPAPAVPRKPTPTGPAVNTRAAVPAASNRYTPGYTSGVPYEAVGRGARPAPMPAPAMAPKAISPRKEDFAGPAVPRREEPAPMVPPRPGGGAAPAVPGRKPGGGPWKEVALPPAPAKDPLAAKPLTEWSRADVALYVAEVMGLPQYVALFAREGVDGSLLQKLGERELADLGITNAFHAAKIANDLSRRGQGHFPGYEIQPNGLLGKGGFAETYLAKSVADGRLYALKVINKEHAKEVEKEASLHMQLHHANVVQYLDGFLLPDGRVAIVMEYCSAGSLYSLVVKTRDAGRYFSGEVVAQWTIQLCQGLEYMHNLTPKMLHRDMKADNVLLSGDGVVKIADFGLAREANADSAIYTVAGTRPYYSPELCEGRAYDEASDLWGVGCILTELLTLRFAYERGGVFAMNHAAMKAALEESDRFDSALGYLCSQLLLRDPLARMTSTGAIRFLQEYLRGG